MHQWQAPFPAYGRPYSHGPFGHDEAYSHYPPGPPLLGRSKPHYDSSQVFVPGKRRRLNLVAILVNIFLPWALFASLFFAMSFSFHWKYPSYTFALVLLGFVVVGFTAYLRKKTRTDNRDTTWYTFTTISFLLAVILGTICGDLNYWYNMQPYFSVNSMNSYPEVNPSRETGQELMDAGRAYFTDGTGLDLGKAMSFTSVDNYCVCPIVHAADVPETYDFWAIGINCCGSSSSDFRCGQYNNPHARSGLRLLRDDQRPFFRLAVQQAEATYGINAWHPLFFTWVQDPIAEMHSYKNDGFKYYFLGITTHFATNLFLVVAATVGFSNIGRY